MPVECVQAANCSMGESYFGVPESMVTGVSRRRCMMASKRNGAIPL